MAMADLAMEKGHLAQADRHVIEGERRIAQQTELVEHIRQKGAYGAAEAERLLQTLRETLETWRSHRENIVEAIARLEGEIASKPAPKPAE
jgi:hypothetical protein